MPDEITIHYLEKGPDFKSLCGVVFKPENHPWPVRSDPNYITCKICLAKLQKLNPDWFPKRGESLG